MHTATHQAGRAVPAFSEFIHSDFSALASHMHACQRSQGLRFRLRSEMERMHGLTAPRIVTTAAVLVVCAVGFLAFA